MRSQAVLSPGWQDSTTYIDTDLSPGTTYTYQVMARDKSSQHNQTAPSDANSATTPWYICNPPIPADFNHDCQVDFTDFAMMASNWLVCNLDPQFTCWQ